MTEETYYSKIQVLPSQFGKRNFNTTTCIVRVKKSIPSSGEISVRVTATGIEASDIVQMAGGYGALQNKKPETIPSDKIQVGDLGCEGVGVIESIGPNVDQSIYKVGNAVCWFGYGVSFREYVNLPVDREVQKQMGGMMVLPVPTPDVQYTAVPISALTATGALELAGNISNNQNVLVTGAAGGTGHIAVQWASKLYNCRVAGTCGSEEKANVLKNIGCHVTVNYKKENIENKLRKEFPNGFDLIFEGIGGQMRETCTKLLSSNGTLISIGSVSEDYTLSNEERAAREKSPRVSSRTGPKKVGNQTITGFFTPAGPNYPNWDAVVQRTIDEIANGNIKILMDKVCQAFNGMDGIYKAQEYMRQGKNIGKIFSKL